MPDITITIPERLVPALGMLLAEGCSRVEERSQQGFIDQAAFDRCQSVRELIERALPGMSQPTDAQIRDTYIARLHDQLDAKASLEFSPATRVMLARSMEAVGWTRYPEVAGDPNGERASSDMICEICGHEYVAHPMDWRVIGYGDVPFLNVLCDGRRVKL